MIKTESIQLDQFLKWANIVATGGQAKHLIKEGKVLVNGEIEKRRSHKISEGDIVELEENTEIFRVSRR